MDVSMASDAMIEGSETAALTLGQTSNQRFATMLLSGENSLRILILSGIKNMFLTGDEKVNSHMIL